MISPVAVKHGLFRFAEIIHLRIFGHAMGKEMKSFFENLSWSFIGGMIASIVMLGVNVGMGRYFGPEEYGKYSLVLSLSQILLIFIYLGTDISSIKFLSGEKELSKKKSILSSSFYLVLASIFFFWAIYYFILMKTGYFFGVERQYVFFILLLSSALGIKGIIDGYLRAYSLFRFQAGLRIIEVVSIIALLFLILKGIGIKEYQHYIYAVVGGASAFSLVALFRLRRNFGTFQGSSLKLMLAYGNVILIGTIFGTVFNSLDKIIVVKYLGVAQLGVYSAYFMTATNLIAQMTQVFNNVFFPAISQVTDTAYIKKINILVRWLFVPGGIVLSLVLYGVLLIFGSAYTPNFYLAVGFGFLSMIQIFLTINATIITALSKGLLKKYYFCLYMVCFFHLVLYGVFIYFDAITIPVILFLFFINFLIVVYLQKRLIINFIKEKDESFSLAV